MALYRGLTLLGIVAATGLLMAYIIGPMAATLPNLRAAFLGAWLATSIVVILRYGLAIYLAPADEERTALRVERLAPHLAGQLIASVQLGVKANRENTAQLYSLTLVDRVIEESAAALRQMRIHETLYDPSLRRNRKILAIEAALLCLALLISPTHFYQSLTTLLRASPLIGGIEDQDSTASGYKTVVGDITVKYFYPVYTRRSPESYPNIPGDLKALKGTQVEMEARCNRPIKEAYLIINERTRIPLRVTPGAHHSTSLLRGELSLMEEGTYRFEFTDEARNRWLDPAVHMIQLEADEPPKAKIDWPAQDLEVSQKDSISIHYQASDDYGISSVALVYEQRGKAGNVLQQRKELSGVRQAATRVSGKYQWSLAELNLEPESELSYYIEALDNDSVCGPKKGMSAVRRLKIYSARQRHRELIKMQEQLLEDMLHVLSALLVKGIDDSKPSPRDPLLLAYEEITAHLTKAVQQAHEILGQMKEDKLANYSVYFALNKIKEDLSNILEHHREEARTVIGKHPLKPLARELLTQLAGFRTEHVKITEKDILLLNSLIDKQNLDEAVAEAQNLAKWADSLSKLLDELKKKEDKETVEKLLRELDRLEEQMARIAEQLAKPGLHIPEEYLNVDALKDLGMAAIQDLIEKIRHALGKGDFKTAQALMQQLLAAMSGFANAISDQSKQYAFLNYSQMLQDIQQFEQRLAELHKQQQAILDETKKMKKLLSERTQAELDRRFKDFFTKQLERLQGMQRDLAGIRSKVENDPEGKNLAQRQKNYEAMLQKRDEMLRSLTFDRNLDAFEQFREQQAGLEEKLQAEEEFLTRHPGYSKIFHLLRNMPNMETQLSELKKMLEGWDVQEARTLARQTVPTLQYWRSMMERPERTGAPSPGMKALLGHVQERVESAAAAGQAMLEDLESLKEAVSDLQRQRMNSVESNAIGDLLKRQSQSRRLCEQLKADVDKFAQKTPLLGHEPVEHLDGASQAMQGAEAELSDRNVGAAVADEREALYHLSQAEQKLKEGKDRIAKGMMGPGLPMPRWVGAQPRSMQEGPYGAMLKEIQLPTPDDYKPPKEFRQDILDAMRAPSPRGFEELNKRYYRRLIE